VTRYAEGHGHHSHGEAMADAADPDGTLIELERRLQAVEAESEGLYAELGEADNRAFQGDPRVRAIIDAARTTIEAIIATPARTAPGVLVKARLMRAEVASGPMVYAAALVESLIADLERMPAMKLQGMERKA
jgi:hypothetical protein